jgi:hypothetical protein
MAIWYIMHCHCVYLRKKLPNLTDGKIGWAKFWAIFCTKTSGRPAPGEDE